MVYVKRWPEFQAACLELYNASPEKTRYLVKLHAARQWLVLKVTDDATTLKFRTRSAVLLNRFEAFNAQVQARMANVPTAASASVGSAEAPPPPRAGAAAADAAASSSSKAATLKKTGKAGVAGAVGVTAGAATRGSATSEAQAMDVDGQDAAKTTAAAAKAGGAAGGGGGGGGRGGGGGGKKKKKKGGKK